MPARSAALVLATVLIIVSWDPDSTRAQPPQRSGTPHESRVPIGNATLYAREIGSGQPIIVLHGGPDFDHTYLLPDLDRLAASFRLIYYDQRGRGQSADHVVANDVTLLSDVADLDEVRRHFQLESPTILGHSWGAVLALEYALRHPRRVSHLVLMNPAPAAASDVTVLRQVLRSEAWRRHRSSESDRRERCIQSR